MGKATGIIVVIVILAILGWIVLSDDEITETSYVGKVIDEGESFTFTDQFSNIEESHWDHMPITYSLEDECLTRLNGRFEKDVRDALDFISKRTDNVVQFEEVVMEEADISFICSIKSAGTWAIGIAEPLVIENIFQPSNIYFYSAYDCMGEKPVVMIHETMHMLGFDHNYNTFTWDLMRDGYYGKEWASATCDLDIRDEDVSCLKYIYSNGEIEGNCSESVLMDFYYEEESLYDSFEEYGECGEGWYPATNNDIDCCPEPEMEAIGEYCY